MTDKVHEVVAGLQEKQLERMKSHTASLYEYLSTRVSTNPEVLSKKEALMAKLEALMAELEGITDPTSRRNMFEDFKEIETLIGELMEAIDSCDLEV